MKVNDREKMEEVRVMSEGLTAVSLAQPGGSWAELGRVAARRSF